MGLFIYWLVYICNLCLFLVTLYICNRYDSSRNLRILSTYLCITIPLFCIVYKLYFDASVCVSGLNIATGAFGFILVLKFLDLTFARPWQYTRQMSWKLVLVYFFSFPKLPLSIAELNKPIDENVVRRENLFLFAQGIIETLMLHIILKWTPLEWLALPSSDLAPHFRPIRYGLLCIIFYLVLTCFLDIAFSLTGLVTHLPMNRIFPSFPFTSTSLREFWSRRWNNYIKTLLHSTSFFVLPELLSPHYKISKRTSGLFACFLSGIFHEYTYWFVVGRMDGRNLIFFILHGFLVCLEIIMRQPSRSITDKQIFLGWLWTFSIVFTSSPLFFDPFIEAGLFAQLK